MKLRRKSQNFPAVIPFAYAWCTLWSPQGDLGVKAPEFQLTFITDLFTGVLVHPTAPSGF